MTKLERSRSFAPASAPASICTGEQVAGFKDSISGKFEELMLIRDEKDLSEFLSRYQVEESEIRREW